MSSRVKETLCFVDVRQLKCFAVDYCNDMTFGLHIKWIIIENFSNDFFESELMKLYSVEMKKKNEFSQQENAFREWIKNFFSIWQIRK